MNFNSLPTPDGAERWALFLDFDGTLAEIAPTPAEVSVPSALPATLSALHRNLDGALALISGRPLAELDAFLAPASLPGAGLHGAELRDGGGTVHRSARPPAGFDAVKAQLEALVQADPRLLLEDKVMTLALHYKRAPGRRNECLDAARRGVDALAGFMLLEGKDVFELKPAGASKGTAIGTFMRAAPFTGRQPVFAGDDVTDENGFDVVNERGGISIKIGGGETRATYRTDSVGDFRDWLDHISQLIATR
ncbi:MAG: trehalose-phosphatase [Gammaproteobacteria bacterium]